MIAPGLGKRTALDAIAAALASPQADEWFRTVTAPLEGGFRAVTARALRTLPFVG